MKSVVRWAVHNSPAMNTLMVGVLLLGAASLFSMRREVFPEFDLEIVLVSVPYPGASPEEAEEGICQKIEEAIQSIDGIKKQTSVAQEGAGFVVIELDPSVKDVQRVLSEIRSEVDRIPSFPELAEDHEVKQITMREMAIQVGIIGPKSDDPQAELRLREVAEEIRDALRALKTVTQASIANEKAYQIDVEISEETLRKYGLTLKQVADILRRENNEIPGGTIRTETQEILVRSKNKHLLGKEITKLPVVKRSDGVVLTVEDLGTVRDEFVDTTSISLINGRPGMAIKVERTKTEDVLKLTQDVKKYVEAKEMPAGYELVTWFDRSVDVRDRMNLLTTNGLQGLLLVFVVLAIFLNMRLAFWVAMGVPIAILGAGLVMFYTGQTLNMLSMFAFLMALGIVVDDAIVIGENIFSHRQRGKDIISAAVDGTIEVLPAVSASVCTTLIAFVPLFFVSGIMGKFIAVLPLVVMAMLVISLIESTIILPCHLAHANHGFFRLLSILLYPLRVFLPLFEWLNEHAARVLHWLVEHVYLPTIRWCLRNKLAMLCATVAVAVATSGLVVTLDFSGEKKPVRLGGIVPFQLFPKLDSNWIEAKVIFPDGTPGTVTDQATKQLEDAMYEVHEKYAAKGMPLLKIAYRTVGSQQGQGPMGPDSRIDGSHLGMVAVELFPTSSRTIKSPDIVKEWRAAAGEISGTEALTFGAPVFGPGGKAIEFKLLARKEDMGRLEAAVEQCKAKLREYPGVVDVDDDSRPGKVEFQLNVEDDAKAMGISQSDLAETIRGSYYGEEVMRLQRGRHEVKLMVRYPRKARRSLADFEDIRVRATDGAERPLTEVARVNVKRGYSEINRVNQLRSITVTADIDEAVANAKAITDDLENAFMPALFAKYPGVSVRWEGQKEQDMESMRSLAIGFLCAVVGMYFLLTIEFRSLLQPLIVLMIIPFGAVGAIWGHYAMGLPLSLFTMFGLVALTGVVVNDSIVLIDFINKRVADGVPVEEAIIDAGRRRFRPVLLTSLTTVAGLTPILLERSFQAQILIPMVNALCFGLIFATVIVLVLVPTVYSIYAKLAFPGTIASVAPQPPLLEGPAARAYVETESESETATS